MMAPRPHWPRVGLEMRERSAASPRLEPVIGLVGYTHLLYALQASAVVTGILTSSSVAAKFLFVGPSLLALVLNYTRRGEVRGTWLKSHFDWQLHTFWYALLWIAITLLIGAPLTLIVVGIYIVVAGFALVGLWVAYRVGRGWLQLRAHRPMPPLLAVIPAVRT